MANTVKVKSVKVTVPGSTLNIPQPSKPVTASQPSTNAIPQPSKPVQTAGATSGAGAIPQPASGLAGLGAALGNAIKTNQSVPKPATTPSTSTSNAIPQPTSTVKNAATSPGTSPATGYGGATYGTNAATNRAIEANQQKIATDPAFRQSEIDRTLQVIAERKAQGLDTSEQEKYLRVNLGYNPPENTQPPTIPQPMSVPNPGVFVPPTPTQQIPIQEPKIPVMDMDAIERYAREQIEARLAAMRQAYEQAKQRAETDASQQSQRLADQLAQAIKELETAASQASQGITTSFERARQNIGENRAVEDVTNARRLSPFSGRSDYALGMIEQERARTDREMLEDYNTRIGNINQQMANMRAALTQQNTTRLSEIQENLANFRREIDEKWALAQTLAPKEREALVREIMQDERNYELMLRGELRSDVLANSQLNNDAFMRALEAYNANRRAYEDDRNFDRSVFENDRNFNWGQYLDVVDRTGNINPNVLNVPAVQSAGANPYAQLLTTGGSQRTLQGQAMDLQNKQANLNAALAVGEATGRLVSPQGDWGGLFRQATNPNTPLNLAGRQFQANEQQRAFQNDLELQRFRENVRQFGLEYAARQAGLSLEQARLELARDDNARQWAALDWQMRQAELERQNPQYSGASFNQVLDSLRSQYMEPVFRTDTLGQQTRVGEQLTQDAAKREELFLRIVQLGLPADQENQAMLLMGLTPDEIALFDRKYGFNQR